MLLKSVTKYLEKGVEVMRKCWILHRSTWRLEETKGEINSKNHAWVTLENGCNIFRHKVYFSEQLGLKRVLCGIKSEIESLKKRNNQIKNRLKALK